MSAVRRLSRPTGLYNGFRTLSIGLEGSRGWGYEAGPPPELPWRPGNKQETVDNPENPFLKDTSIYPALNRVAKDPDISNYLGVFVVDFDSCTLRESCGVGDLLVFEFTCNVQA